MRTVLTHRIELKPNKLQEALFRQCVGASRFAFNWALAEWQRHYAAGEKPNEAALRRPFNAIKPVDFPWILDLPKSVPQQAIKHVGRAYQRFFQKSSKYPRFKKRGHHDSARLDNGPGTFAVEGQRIRLPKIGGVRMREALRFDGKPLSATLSREADRWFISISVEIACPEPVRESPATVGVDLGVSTKLCSSCGVKAEAMPLSVRQWTCAHCGAEHDRDINAALNIERESLATASWAGSHACGEDGAGRSRKTPTKPASMKQEISHDLLGYG